MEVVEILLCSLGGVEERDVLNIHVACTVAGEEVEAAVGDDTVLDGGQTCVVQIQNCQVPVVVLVPSHAGHVALTGPAGAGADEDVSVQIAVGAVCECHVRRQLEVRAKLDNGHVRIAAVGGQTNEGHAILSDDLVRADVLSNGLLGGASQLIDVLGIQNQHGSVGIDGLGLLRSHDLQSGNFNGGISANCQSVELEGAGAGNDTHLALAGSGDQSVLDGLGGAVLQGDDRLGSEGACRINLVDVCIVNGAGQSDGGVGNAVHQDGNGGTVISHGQLRACSIDRIDLVTNAGDGLGVVVLDHDEQLAAAQTCIDTCTAHSVCAVGLVVVVDLVEAACGIEGLNNSIGVHDLVAADEHPACAVGVEDVSLEEVTAVDVGVHIVDGGQVVELALAVGLNAGTGQRQLSDEEVTQIGGIHGGADLVGVHVSGEAVGDVLGQLGQIDHDLLAELNNGTVSQLGNEADEVIVALQVLQRNLDLEAGCELAACAQNVVLGGSLELAVDELVVVHVVAEGINSLIEADPAAEGDVLQLSSGSEGQGVVDLVQLCISTAVREIHLAVDVEGVKGVTLHTGIGDLGEGRILLEVVLGNCLLAMEEADVSDVDGATLGESVASVVDTVGLVGLTVLVENVAGLQSIEAEVRNVLTVVLACFNERLSVEDGYVPLAVGDNGLTEHSAVIGGAVAGGSDVHLYIGTGSIGAVTDRNVAGTVYACEGIPVRIGTERNDVNVAVLKGQAILSHVAGIAAGDGLNVFSTKHVHGLHGISGLGLLSCRRLGGILRLGGGGSLGGIIRLSGRSFGRLLGGFLRIGRLRGGILNVLSGLFGRLVGYSGVIRLLGILASHKNHSQCQQKGKKN